MSHKVDISIENKDFAGISTALLGLNCKSSPQYSLLHTEFAKSLARNIYFRKNIRQNTSFAIYIYTQGLYSIEKALEFDCLAWKVLEFLNNKNCLNRSIFFPPIFKIQQCE